LIRVCNKFEQNRIIYRRQVIDDLANVLPVLTGAMLTQKLGRATDIKFWSGGRPIICTAKSVFRVVIRCFVSKLQGLKGQN